MFGQKAVLQQQISPENRICGYADHIRGEEQQGVWFYSISFEAICKKKLALLLWNLFKNKIKKWKGTIVNRQNIASTNSYFIIIF